MLPRWHFAINGNNVRMWTEYNKGKVIEEVI